MGKSGQIQLAEATALVDVQTMDTSATLVQGLHDCICDVVSELDHEQRMQEPCPALMANKTDSERGHAKAARSKSDLAC